MARSRRTLLIAGVLVGVAVARAWQVRWLCDDAFFSFRYARNLVRGLGLVYNEGERVEGFSNLSWTLWIAAGLSLGFEAESWSVVSGVAAFGVILGLLTVLHLRTASRSGLTVPTGLLIAAASLPLQQYATSGLETSAFSALILAGFVFLHRPGLAGGVLALAALTRPEGPLLAVIAAGSVLAMDGARAATRLALGFSVIWGPATLARVAYYGHFFPNTYYAKSGGLPWWEQGTYYVALFLEHQPWMLAVPFALLVPAARPCAVGAIVYAVYVARVGGDFMHARFMIPAAILGLAAIDRAVGALVPRLPSVALALASLAGVSALAPSPMPGGLPMRGIDDEARVYTTENVRLDEARLASVRPLVAGLPISAAIVGKQARLAWRLDLPTVVEAAAGLTDATIARQELVLPRLRVGHEKMADPEYLTRRGVDLLLSTDLFFQTRLNSLIPWVPVRIGDITGMLGRWNGPLVEQLRARGASVGDYPRLLDQDIRELAALPDDEARLRWERHERFYFRWNEDPVRLAAFTDRGL